MNDYPNRPLIGVGVVVFRGPPDAPEVLLIRRGKPPRQGQWSVPGGRQRLGERVREAVAREVREETGCAVAVSALLDVVDSMTRDPDGTLRFHYTLIDFLAEWRAGDARAGADAAEVAWANARDLERYGLWGETLRLIGLGLERRGQGT